MKATPEELELHGRLLAGDGTASAVIVEKFLMPLIRSIQSSFPRVDEPAIWDVAVDAVLEYTAKPQRYDPGKMALQAYLRMDATGNLKNILQRQKRLIPSGDIEDIVELQPVHWNRERTLPGGDQILINRELLERLDAVVPDPIERKILMLMMDHEHRTEVFAEAMGIQHLGSEEQRVEVKRAKDRIKARLRRAGRHAFL